MQLCKTSEPWESCEHKWVEVIDSQYSSEYSTAMVCVKCNCPGQMDNKSLEVDWPTT